MFKSDTLHVFWALCCVVFLTAFSTEKVAMPAEFFPPSGGITDLDTVRIHLTDCSQRGRICVEVPLAQTLKMDVTDNGQHDLMTFAGCDFDSIMAYTVSNLFGQGTLGPYLLNKWTVDGVIHTDTFQNIPELVTLMNGWDPLGNWIWDPNALLISGGHPGSGYSSMDVTVLLFNTPSSIGFNLGFDPKGTELSIARGFHEIILNDTIAGLADTFYVHVSCSDYIDLVINLGDTVQYCQLTNDLLTAPFGTENVCNDTAGAVNFQQIPGGVCVQAIGNQYGTEQSCWVICDSTGFCDTTFFSVRVLYPGTKSASFVEVPVGQSATFCFDTLRLNGPVASYGFCAGSGGPHVGFDLDPETFCVSYTGEKIGGIDTVCVVVCDDLGACDTMIFYATARASQKIIYDTIFVGSQLSFCADSSVFFGDTLTVTNFCQNSQGQAITFDIDPLSLCLVISAIATGTDTACLSICDELGACDTVRLIITAIEEVLPMPPLANPDDRVTLLSTPVVIPVLDNDLIPDSTAAVTIELVSSPLHGTATVDSLTNEVIYTPDSTFCGDADAFFYRVCQNDVCDTALISITVECDSDTSTVLEFFTGFSPNGDGQNDYFEIRNVEKYPQNDLTIFTRWGLRIFFQQSYRNGWDGKFENIELPDGVYFYLFNDGKGGQHNSYFVLRH